MSDFFLEMKEGKKDKYKVRYAGLAEGTHEYDYKLGKEFFLLFDNSSIENAHLNVKISIKKDSERLMEIVFSIIGVIELQCDRCLDYFEHPVQIEELLFVKLGKSYQEEAENIIIWPENNPYFDIAPHIHDYVELSLPYQKVHPLDKKGNQGCNGQMIEQLNKYLILSDNQEIDPRWNQLKNLLN